MKFDDELKKVLKQIAPISEKLKDLGILNNFDKINELLSNNKTLLELVDSRVNLYNQIGYNLGTSTKLQETMSALLGSNKVFKSFEALQSVYDSFGYTHLKYILNNISGFNEKISIAVDENLEFDLTPKNLKEVSEKLNSFGLSLTEEENKKLTIVICILIVLTTFLLILDENQLKSVEKFLNSLTRITKDILSDFSKGTLDSLSPFRLGNAFGDFVRLYFLSILKSPFFPKKEKSKKKKKKKKKKRKK